MSMPVQRRFLSAAVDCIELRWKPCRYAGIAARDVKNSACSHGQNDGLAFNEHIVLGGYSGGRN
jgi:hypothetical protein